MKACCKLFVGVLLFIVVTGCARLLPSTIVKVDSPWQGFDEAKTTYEKIIPGTTTVKDLKELGYDPFIMPNIKILNATEIIIIFLPNPSIKQEDLEPGIQQCIKSKDRCTAYQILPSMLHVNRIGNFWLDFFTFKRHAVNTGWEFRGVIIIVDNVVTYRDPPGGRPLIHTEQVDIKPLGPLQEMGTALLSEIPKMIVP